MAYFLCNAGSHVNPRKNYLVYVGHGGGTEIRRWKLRFCRTHLAGIQEDLAEYEVPPEDGAVSLSSAFANCLACGQPIHENGWNLFVTCYPPENERKDYWSRIHLNCRVPEYLREELAA